ncbi:MAG: mandelate racemase/muconate lactonizing enzyme family protein [SAR202 cluster bacterium]|nr:mandelate racemase/muconate lactonizing enzyme family protein [SAR202 cluster bacterium]
MKITRVSATSHVVPVPAPLLHEKQNRAMVFVQVETDEGLTGYGLTGPIQRHGTREFINREVARQVIGMDPVDTERIWQKLYLELNPRAQTGVWSSGVSAVDIALWDIKGKKLGMPVWRLLGGYQNPVPAYITFGLLEYDIDQLVEVAKGYVAQGEDKLKMVVAINGANDPMEDARRVRAVRDAIGPKAQLSIDANYLFNFTDALKLAKLTEGMVEWFEEPIYGNDARLLHDLRMRTSTPISAGQNEGHRFRHRELLVNNAVDILQPNVVYCGGYTEGVKIAAMAQAFNLKIANGGGWPHHNMHLQAAMSNGWRVEFHYLMWKLGEMIYKDPPGPNKGWTTVSDKPGLGLEPRFDALKEFQDKLDGGPEPVLHR